MTPLSKLRCLAAIWIFSGFALLVVARPSRARPMAARPEAGAANGQQPTRPSVPQPPPGLPSEPDVNSPPLTPKQRRALLKANYNKMKQEADELVALAKSLQEDLNKSNENVLSVDVIDKADRIEKLAKKIRTGAID